MDTNQKRNALDTPENKNTKHTQWLKRVEKVTGQNIISNEFILKLEDDILLDTYLTVRYHNPFGKDRWAHYIIFRVNPGKTKTYRDIYRYFVEKEGFLAAYGYILFEDESKTYWLGQSRYFRFDRTTPPEVDTKILDSPLRLQKPQYK